MTDCYGIIGVELLLAGLLLVSAWHSIRTRRHRGAIALVDRGPVSRENLGIAYGFGSVLILQIVNSSEAFKGHKVLLSLADVGALFYLCFLSGWFRNKVIGWFARWEKTPERH